MITQEMREALREEALTWIDTPFHSNQKSKGTGADCIGLIVGIAEACGIPLEYWNNYSLRPDGTLEKELRRQMIFRGRHAVPEIGDVILMSFEQTPHHVAMHIGGGEIIHSYAQARKCVRQEYNLYWIDVSRGVFSFA